MSKDAFSDIFEAFNKPPAKSKEEKGLPWAAKEINGHYYVPLEQVVELLKQNEVLPKVRRGLEAQIHLLEQKKNLDI